MPFVSPCLASVEELQHSQGFPLPPEASNRCLLEAPEIEEAPEVPFCVGDAKKCNHLPGPGLTDSRPSKLRSLSLITLVTPCLQGLKKTYSAHVLHMPGVRFDRSGSHRAEGQQVRSKTCDGTVPSARLSQHWVHRPMRHRAPFLP